MNWPFVQISRELSIRLTNFLRLMSGVMEMFVCVCGRMSVRVYLRKEMLENKEHLYAGSRCSQGIHSESGRLKM
jgi:hypothetical protein